MNKTKQIQSNLLGRAGTGDREEFWIALNKTAVVCVFSKMGRGGKGRMPLARAAKRLKRLKTAMGSYWKKLAWIWVWRHVGLGLGSTGTCYTVNAITAKA